MMICFEKVFSINQLNKLCNHAYSYSNYDNTHKDFTYNINKCNITSMFFIFSYNSSLLKVKSVLGNVMGSKAVISNVIISIVVVNSYLNSLLYHNVNVVIKLV